MSEEQLLKEQLAAKELGKSHLNEATEVLSNKELLTYLSCTVVVSGQLLAGLIGDEAATMATQRLASKLAAKSPSKKKNRPDKTTHQTTTKNNSILMKFEAGPEVAVALGQASDILTELKTSDQVVELSTLAVELFLHVLTAEAGEQYVNDLLVDHLTDVCVAH